MTAFRSSCAGLVRGTARFLMALAKAIEGHQPRADLPSAVATKSVWALIDALGGTFAVAEITGLKPSAVSNWKARGRIPPKEYLLLSRHLVSMDKAIDPAAFNFAAVDRHPLKTYRERCGITLYELAELVGSTKASLSRVENGKQTPSLDLIGKLKEATGGALTADDFLPNHVA